MPTYEMTVLMRVMSKPELVGTLKRTAEAIFDKGGFIRKIDNLGKQAIPYKIRANNQTHKDANYFIVHFDAPPTKITILNDEINRDVDIIRGNFYLTPEEPKEIECTLHDELLPPAYRSEVQKMIKAGEKQKAKKEKRRFQFNTNLGYYPFQR